MNQTWTAPDGTPIAYRVVGQGPEWLVLCHGYGGTFNAWDPVLARLEDRFRVVMWDYRGMHASQAPADRRRLRIEDHCRDLDGLLGHLGVQRCILGGWSVGVQVALEAWRRIKTPVRALMLINGAHERILDNVFGGSPMARRVARALVRGVETASPALMPLARPVLKRLGRSRLALPILEAAGTVTGRPPAMLPAIQSILDLDFRRYMFMVRLAADHRTAHWLPEIDVPVLLTAGALDVLTPPSVAREAVRRLRDVRYHEFPLGTHYTLMEFPGELATLMRRFADRLPEERP